MDNDPNAVIFAKKLSKSKQQTGFASVPAEMTQKSQNLSFAATTNKSGFSIEKRVRVRDTSTIDKTDQKGADPTTSNK